MILELIVAILVFMVSVAPQLFAIGVKFGTQVVVVVYFMVVQPAKKIDFTYENEI